MPACRLVVGQLAAGLKAIAEGILADKDGQQVSLCYQISNVTG